MADETEGQQQEEMAAADFDWGKFFADDSAEEEEPALEMSEEPQGRSEEDRIAKAEADAARALQLAQAASQQTQMKSAIEAWKAQASPAELLAEPMLLKATTPEELQNTAAYVKDLASTLTSNLAERDEQIKRQVELQMQKEYGLPVTPTFQPMPEKEKIDAALAEGDLVDAANKMMKGFFSS